MKIAILTFQFAHNYGALLQAFALQNFIKTLGHKVNIVPYCPKWAQMEYTINPFEKGITYRKRIKLALQYPKRKKQSNVFEKFQIDELNLEKKIEDVYKLKEYLDSYDCVVCGSDQIWNDSITGDTEAYFGCRSKTKKIAYAVSLGTDTLSPVQEKNILEFLPEFSKVSVREEKSKNIIQRVLETVPIEVVLDPVFFMNKSEWVELSNPVEIQKPFMLLYLLQENKQLLSMAADYAKRNNLTIYEIHPTLAKFHYQCKPLTCVGPKEFLWLVNNSECVCTNSFHATAFSIIFNKKLLHIPNSKSPGRTTSLLKRMNIGLKNSDVELPLYDFRNEKNVLLEKEISFSKQFLINALVGE